MGGTNKPIRLRHHKNWDSYVKNIAGGLTILKPAKGVWVCPESKELYAERMIPVEIACNEKQMDKIAEFTKQHYRQLAVMVVTLSTEVKFY